MSSLWQVLWFWSAVSWGFHGVVLSPGWAAVMVYEAADAHQCVEDRDRVKLRPKDHAIMCLPAGVQPVGRIAEGR